MKKGTSIIAVVSLVAIAAALASCGQEKYADVKNLLTEAIAANESCARSLETATSADAVAAAITAYVDSLKKMGRRIEGMPEKYPELKDQAQTPADLRALHEKWDKTGKAALDAIMEKTAAFPSDPKIEAALKLFETD